MQGANPIQRCGGFSNYLSGSMECVLDRTIIDKACNGGVVFMPVMFEAGETGDFEIIAACAFGDSLDGVALTSLS